MNFHKSQNNMRCGLIVFQYLGFTTNKSLHPEFIFVRLVINSRYKMKIKEA